MISALVVPVFSDISDNVGYPYDTSLQSTGNEPPYRALICAALLLHAVKFLERQLIRTGSVFLHFHFAIMAYDTVKGLKRKILTADIIKDPDRMDVMIEISAGTLMIKP